MLCCLMTKMFVIHTILFAIVVRLNTCFFSIVVNLMAQTVRDYNFVYFFIQNCSCIFNLMNFVFLIDLFLLKLNCL